MKYSEVIEELTSFKDDNNWGESILELLDTAIFALTEIQLYHSLGTYSDLKLMVEKQKAKKPIFVHVLQLDDEGDYMCPTCKTGSVLNAYGDKSNNCPYCGQALDWEEINI